MTGFVIISETDTKLTENKTITEQKTQRKPSSHIEQKNSNEVKSIGVVVDTAPKKIVPFRNVKANMDKLAIAVAIAETNNCAKGYGILYNNCFGIKNGGIAPCEKIGKSKMCIYDSPEESYEAFKKIWTQRYGGYVPTIKIARVWTGKDRAKSWLKNVLYYYNR